jgi:hypothetical protein
MQTCVGTILSILFNILSVSARMHDKKSKNFLDTLSFLDVLKFAILIHIWCSQIDQKIEQEEPKNSIDHGMRKTLIRQPTNIFESIHCNYDLSSNTISWNDLWLEQSDFATDLIVSIDWSMTIRFQSDLEHAPGFSFCNYDIDLDTCHQRIQIMWNMKCQHAQQEF